MSHIGMMDGAFFVGRKEIVEWINETCELSITKIEDTAFGGIACMLLDIMYPGQVPMHKVDWSAKQSFEYVANYKVLQTCFVKLGIEKNIDVDRLIKGRYQDNLEFMQWFKRFFEMHMQGKGDYDCTAQRLKGKGGDRYTYAGKGASGGKSTVSKPAVISRGGNTSSRTLAAKPETVSKPEEKLEPTPPLTSKVPVKEAHPAPKDPVPDVEAYLKEIEAQKAKAEAAVKEVTDMRLVVEDLTKERDFYFDKLREVEVALQDMVDQGQGNEITDALFKILYATAEGFEALPAESELQAEASEEN